MPTRDCSLEEFAARLRDRSKAHAANAPRDCRPLSEGEKIARDNHEAHRLAKEEGLMYTYAEIAALGVPAPSGVENDVYFDATTNTMIKVNNLMISRSVQRLLHRLTIHNKIFPQTRYRLIGFAEISKGTAYPVLTQDYVPNATYATHGEILDYMEALGFHLCGEATFTNGELTISDLRPRNVLKTSSGQLFVVDADFTEEQSGGSAL